MEFTYLRTLLNSVQYAVEELDNKQDRKGRFSEVLFELYGLMKNAWAMFYCTWNMAICIADKPLSRDLESILPGAMWQF